MHEPRLADGASGCKREAWWGGASQYSTTMQAAHTLRHNPAPSCTGWREEEREEQAGFLVFDGGEVGMGRAGVECAKTVKWIHPLSMRCLTPVYVTKAQWTFHRKCHRKPIGLLKNKFVFKPVLLFVCVCVWFCCCCFLHLFFGCNTHKLCNWWINSSQLL